ncbi:uncharacterized protein [Mytilus edulis]|uniref:uncharacterized protein n=1 Tax=Mytilus edulis TaxID=6550 RepID=UPI0039EF0A81
MISWVKLCYCPNYFIPEHNMFVGKIDQSNNTMLLCVLKSLQCGGIDGLLHNLFPLDNTYNGVLRTTNESPFIDLDFLLYRNICPTNDALPKRISSYYKALLRIEYYLNSELSTFIIDACKCYINFISREIAHLLPQINAKGYTYHIHKLYYTLFRRIIKTNAVSGWLLYASFYYVTGQFNVTLKITDYVLSRYSPDLMVIDSSDVDNKISKNKYKHNVHTSMSLNERLTIATACHVNYRPNSSLIPEELKLEVKCNLMNILPNAMCYCLRFLCNHHLGDTSNRQQTLRDLYIAVQENGSRSENTESNALTILGVCFDISGDKDMAYECYYEALQCNAYVCPSAEARISKLFDI